MEKREELNPTEQIIFDYVQENASEVLKEKIEKSEKGIKDCLNYISSEVRNRAINNCACVSDQEVFGMAMHYFEEDSIKKDSVNVTPAKVETSKPVEKPKPHKKEEKVCDGQMSMFELLGV